MRHVVSTTAAVVLLVLPSPVAAQAAVRPADVASPEAIVLAAYDVIARAPGEAYDWDRFRSLFLPEARLIPNTEQTGGEFRILTPGEFTAWADSFTVVGGPDDQGFVEEQIATTIERYGDVAHAFSTYRKRFWDVDETLGRGINSFQLVRHDDRWWIAGIVWDEECCGGPIPEAYLP